MAASIGCPVQRSGLELRAHHEIARHVFPEGTPGMNVLFCASRSTALSRRDAPPWCRGVHRREGAGDRCGAECGGGASLRFAIRRRRADTCAISPRCAPGFLQHSSLRCSGIQRHTRSPSTGRRSSRRKRYLRRRAPHAVASDPAVFTVHTGRHGVRPSSPSTSIRGTATTSKPTMKASTAGRKDRTTAPIGRQTKTAS